MALLIVTFGRVRDGSAPVMDGEPVRTDKLTIAAEVTDPVLSAASIAGEDIADLHAGADCWVELGASPDATDPGSGLSDSHFMASGERRQFKIRVGTKVSVIAA